jgi:hypothetical protein
VESLTPEFRPAGSRYLFPKVRFIGHELHETPLGQGLTINGSAEPVVVGHGVHQKAKRPPNGRTVLQKPIDLGAIWSDHFDLPVSH